jgi:hypothetical protein
MLHQVAGTLALRRGDLARSARELVLALEQQWFDQRNRDMSLMTLDLVARLALRAGRPDDAWMLIESIDRSRAAHHLRRQPVYAPTADAARREAAVGVKGEREALSLIASSWSTDDLVAHACTLLRELDTGD